MRGRAVRVGLLALVAFFLMGAAWAIALPSNGTYDENQHIVRAYAVVDGQLLPSGKGVDAAGLPAEAFRAPRSLLPENSACTWQPRPPQPAACQRKVTDSTRTDMPTQAARYSPVYYALVGLPLRVSPDFTGVVVARLISALLLAMLLASAMAIAARYCGRLMVAAVALVSTPMVLNLGGAVNPNGMEIGAGVLLFVSLLALVRGRQDAPSPADASASSLADASVSSPADASASSQASADSPVYAGADGIPRVLLVAAAVAAALLTTLRLPTAPALMVGAVVACGLVAPRQRLLALLRSRAVRLGLGLPIAGSLLFAAWWVMYSGAADIEQIPGRGKPYGVGEILLRLPGERFRFYAEQVVARFSYGETTVSPLLVAAWYLLFAAMIAPALWFGGARLRLAIGGVFAASLGMLVVLEVHFVPTFGWFSHSRYVAALGVGMMLLAATSSRYQAFLSARGWLGAPVTLLVAATIPLDMYALVRVMSRFQRGIAASLNPFGGTWTPPLGTAAPLLAELLGALALASIVAWTDSRWRAGRDRRAEDAVTDRSAAEMVVARKDELG